MYLGILVLFLFASFNYVVGAETDTSKSSISITATNYDGALNGVDIANTKVSVTVAVTEDDCKTGGSFGIWGMDHTFKVVEISMQSFQMSKDQDLKQKPPMNKCTSDLQTKTKDKDNRYYISYTVTVKQYQTLVYGYVRTGQISDSWTWENEITFLQSGAPTPPKGITYYSNFGTTSTNNGFPPPRNTLLRYNFRDKNTMCTVPDTAGDGVDTATM